MAAGDFGGKGLPVQATNACLPLGTRQRTLIASEHRLVETGDEIAIESVERGGFDANIQLLRAGRIETPRRSVGIDGVIGLGVNGPGQPLCRLFLRAVVGEGHERLTQYAPLCVECDARFVAQIAVKAACPLHGIGDGLGADRSFGETYQRPIEIAGHNPSIQLLAPCDVLILKCKLEAQRPAHHSRCQFEQRDPVVAFDGPGRARTPTAGKLSEL